MTGSEKKEGSTTAKQKSQGDQSPNVAAAGDVTIHYGKTAEERSDERKTQEERHKSQQRTAIKVALIGAAATIVGAVLGLFGDADKLWDRLSGEVKIPEVVSFSLSNSAMGFEEGIEPKFNGSPVKVKSFQAYYPFANEPRAIFLTTISNPTNDDLIITSVTYMVEEIETVKGGPSGPLEALASYQHEIAHRKGEQKKALIPPFRVTAGDTASLEIEISSASPGDGLGWLLHLAFDSNLGEFSTESFWLYLPKKGGTRKVISEPSAPDIAEPAQSEPQEIQDDILLKRIEVGLPDPRYRDCVFRKAGVYADIEHLDAVDRDILFARAGWSTVDEFAEKTTETVDPVTYGDLLVKPKMTMLLRLIKTRIECVY